MRTAIDKSEVLPQKAWQTKCLKKNRRQTAPSVHLKIDYFLS